MPNNNYNTLHKDIELTEKDYGLWDINFTNGDLKSATDKNSLRTGLIIACLTSWNYLNKKGNPIYETFGNRAYEELKKKKSNMVKYKIQQYFIEVLNRIRRVQNVETLEVYEIQNQPNDYFVKFTVIALNDELVNGSFNISTSLKQQDSQISCTALMPFATNHNPLKVELQLCNEYGTGISGETIYIYTKEHDESDYKFYKIAGPTDEDGYLRGEYKPQKREDNDYGETSIKFVFRGNTTHNGCESLPLTFSTDYNEYNLSFITEDFTTNNETESILFKLEEKSLKEQKYTPVQKETIYIKGDDGSLYETVTNTEGVGKCEIHLKQTTRYTVSYGTLKDELTVTIEQGNITVKTLEEPPLEHYIQSKYSFKLQLLNENNKPIKNLPFTIEKDNETVYTGHTTNNGLISYSEISSSEGTSTWVITTLETSFYTQKEITFSSETLKHSPLLGLNVEKSVNERNLYLTFDYEYSEEGGYILFSDIPNEQIRLICEEDYVKIEFHKINQYFEWNLREEDLQWDEYNEMVLSIEEHITSDSVDYLIIVGMGNIWDKSFSISIPKTSDYAHFDNLIYDKSSNITNITNNHNLTCFNDEPLILESKVCNLPLLSNEQVHFYANDTEISTMNIINGKADLIYSFDGMPSGTYYLQAKIHSTEISNSAESYMTKVTVIEHDYDLDYEVINNSTIKFTFTDWEQPVKNKKVRLYSEETGYEKALYTDNEGSCTFTNVIYGGLYHYTCETFSGTIQNGEWESLMGSLRTCAKVRNANTSYDFTQDSSVWRIINRSTSEEGYVNVFNIISLDSSKELEIEMASDIPYYGIFFGEHNVSTLTGIDVIEVEENEIYINVQMKDGSNYIPVPSNEMMINEYSPIKLRFKIYSDNYMRGYYNGSLLGEWELKGDDIQFMVGAGGTLYISNFKILITE